MNFVTYSKNEKAHDDVNYFLMEIKEMNMNSDSPIKEIKMFIDSQKALEIEVSIQTKDLPLYCFKDENVSSIEELNFNELQKCPTNSNTSTNKKPPHKYMIVFLGEFNNTKSYLSNTKKSFSEWNNKELNIQFELLNNKNNWHKYMGKMLKVFHKQYQPEITATK